MAARRRTQIAAGTPLLSTRDLLSEYHCRKDLIQHVVTSNANVLVWLARRRLIHNQCPCAQCGILCSIIVDLHCPDDFVWRCPNCFTKESVRRGSVFAAHRKLSLGLQLVLLYEWSYDTPLHCVEREYQISHPTAVSFYARCRRICTNYLTRHPTLIGGTEVVNGVVRGKFVEIDESYFTRRKYNRGSHFRRGVWVIGGIERASGNCFLQVVTHRDRNTLQPIIERHVAPRSHIVTDFWRAYDQLNRSQRQYTHDHVNHSQNFVDPLRPEIHTNNIENLWYRIKRKHKRICGTYELIVFLDIGGRHRCVAFVTPVFS